MPKDTHDIEDKMHASITPMQAKELLRAQRNKAKALLENRPLISAATQAWETVTRDVLTKAFGAGSPNVANVMDVGRFRHWAGDTEGELEAARVDDMQKQVAIIDALIEMLEIQLSTSVDIPVFQRPNSKGRSVFLVHGHNDAILHETARFLEKLGVEPVVLREQPNSGRTIIEKFVDYSSVLFAVVLLTADDRGGTKDMRYEQQSPRARQNVILELGFFIGKLGRVRVCALCQEGVEIPSDYSGVVFVALDPAGAWKLTLAKEMKAVGMEIDLNAAM